MTSNRYLAAIAVMAACGLLPGVAQAGGLDYSYLDLNYLSIVPQDDPILQNGTALEVNGSYALPANLTVQGGYSRASFDLKGFPSSVYAAQDGAGVGVGYHYPLAAHLDLVVEVNYGRNREWIETPTITGPNVTVHPLELGIGLRGMATDRLELHGNLGWTRFNGSDSHATGVNLGLIYDLFPNLGLGLGYGHDTTAFPATTSGTATTPAGTTTSHQIALFVRLQF